ncbi:MAG: sterol desaturase family protein [Polyangiaceae bacterium]|nr:sterol desaturase family protein [Polyangiaceae bacterium]
MWLWETLVGLIVWTAKGIAEHATTTRFLASFGFFLLVVLAQRVAGRLVGYVAWTRALLKSAAASLGIALLNFSVYPTLLAMTSHGVERLWLFLRVPRLPASTWQGLPLWLVALIVVVAYDFADYWNHRLMHSKWVWPIHAIHHSDPVITPLATHRVHPFEGLVMWTSYFVLLGWLNLPQGTLGIGAVILLLHNEYVHMNVDWNHGPLWFLVASPRFHRWHHADVPQAHGKNLANVFPAFDLLFGTYYNPGPCTERVGAEGVPENDVVKLMLFPFVAWAKLAGAWTSRLRSRFRRTGDPGSTPGP